MTVSDAGGDDAWIARWLDAVRDGGATMSRRAMSSIERRGGIAVVVAAAQERGVHLAEITDERGKVLVAASIYPIRLLC